MKIDRIAALLAKAERTDNPAEADAYLMKAQALATLASIDLATARNHTNVKESSTPVSRTVSIGEKGKRANTHLVSLFVAVAHSNSTHVDVARDSTYVISYGMKGDLDSVDTLFASLAVQMTTQAHIFITSGSWRGESFDARVKVAGGYRRKRTTFTAQTARAAFYRAYVTRIDERLREGRQEGIKQSDAREEPGAQSAALVLASREKMVSEFHRNTSKARGSWGGYSGAATGNSGSAAGAGRKAASRARLSESPALAGSRGALPR